MGITSSPCRTSSSLQFGSTQKANYPDDKAFDFKVGDLRGMYAVYMPELSAALAANP